MFVTASFVKKAYCYVLIITWWPVTITLLKVKSRAIKSSVIISLLWSWKKSSSSCSYTSKAKPCMRFYLRAWIAALVSIRAPRPVFTIITLGFILFIVSVLIICRVVGVSGQCREITSLSLTRVYKSTNLTPYLETSSSSTRKSLHSILIPNP